MSTTTGAHRLIDSPVFVETTGATVHMLACATGGPAEIGGIYDVRGVFAQRHKVEVAAVSARLESVGGDRQSRSATEAVELLRAPPRQIYTVAVVHHQSGGGDVRASETAAEGGGPNSRAEIGGQFGHELTAARHVVLGVVDPLQIVGGSLSENMRQIVVVAFDQIGLVIAWFTNVGAV